MTKVGMNFGGYIVRIKIIICLIKGINQEHVFYIPMVFKMI